MPRSMQDIIDLARIPLNDADKTRYADTTLLLHANHALLAVLQVRPDLFVGRFDSLPDGTLELDEAFPLADQYASAVADYITARAETVDDEHINNQRATLFFTMFGAQMNG